MRISLNMDWHVDIFSVLIRHNISIVTHVPDAGHSPLLKLCDEAPDIELVTLTAEQDGVGVLCGAWAGGTKGVLLMQSRIRTQRRPVEKKKTKKPSWTKCQQQNL